VLAAGVAVPDLLMREGLHPETPPLSFTPGWELIGMVGRLAVRANVGRLHRVRKEV
jgi:NADPH2:quinone reductase